MNFLDYLGPFLLLLGILVVVHELGHFAVAKWFNVKVERFSVGFGPSILRRTIGETEYVVAWLPLGGYVKMAGESPDEELAPEDVERSFNAQSPARRIAIALAGPGMNLLLSVVVIAGLFMTGWPTPTSLVGSVLPDSPAEQAGLQPGDRIVAVEGEEIWRWRELTEAVRAHDGAPLALTVERAQERLALTVTPRSGPEDRGPQIGISPVTSAAVLGVPEPRTPAARAGLETGDEVVALNGAEVPDWYAFVRALERTSGPLELTIARPLDGETETAVVSIPAVSAQPWTLDGLGIVHVDFAVRQLLPGRPAKRAGFEIGDIVLQVGGQNVQSFDWFVGAVRGSKGEAMRVVVLRDGRKESIDVTALPETERVDGEMVTIYRIGLSSGPPGNPGELVDDVVSNPLKALWLGAVRTGDIFFLIVDGVRMLLTREVGIENLAGPIGIGELAADSFAEEGWLPFLWMMCVISVNLAILNLLPIPILDGGHILFAVAQAVRGKQVGTRAREVAQTVGITFVILLMGFAFWNDISRNWSGIIGFFKDLI
jgi:regulator of sigma E protease